MLIWVKVGLSAPSRDINLPPKIRHRSCEGDTLIVTAGQSHEFTGEEWDHILAEHGDLLPHFQILNSPPKKG
jgi:hypothetical protein